MRKTLIAAALFAFAGSAFAAPVTYKIDPGHTNVLASWDHFGYSNPSINFGKAEGSIVYDAENVPNSSVQVTLPLTGLSALADEFYDHLTGDYDDFSDIVGVDECFPTIARGQTQSTSEDRFNEEVFAEVLEEPSKA